MLTSKTRREQIVEGLKEKAYRDEYVAALVSVGLPSQIRELRLARGWSQQKLASKVPTGQSKISAYERTGCESFTMSSLLRLASAFDVGLKVRFVPFSELVHEDAHPEHHDLNVPSFGYDARLAGETVGQETQFRVLAPTPFGFLSHESSGVGSTLHFTAGIEPGEYWKEETSNG